MTIKLYHLLTDTSAWELSKILLILDSIKQNLAVSHFVGEFERHPKNTT